MVKLRSFHNAKGKEIMYLEMEADRFPMRIGLKKARKLLQNATEVEAILVEQGM